MTDESAPSLNELDKEEWWDIGRMVRPGYTREQFETDWEEFVRIKRERLRKQDIN